MTTIKKSLIQNAGNGLFAIKNYKKDEFICYYDGEEKQIETLNDLTYCITNPFNLRTLVGYNYVKNENGVGQFINDYCMFELTDNDRDEQGFYKLSSTNINNKINEYTSLSAANSNVTFKKEKNNLFKLYASRIINENEELYLHYGVDYWISKIQITCDEPFTRLYCLLKNRAIEIKNKNIYFENKEIDPDKILYILGISLDGNIIQALKLEKFSNKQKVIKIIKMLS